VKKQEEILEEFRKKIGFIPDVKQKINEILEFCNTYGDTLGVKLSEVIELGIDLAREINDEVREVACLHNLLFFRYMTEGKVNSRYANQMTDLPALLDKLKTDPQWYAFGLNVQSFIYWFDGKYETAFNMAYEVLKMPDEIPVHGKGWTYFSLGVFYFDTKDFENSRFHYQGALDIFSNEKFDYGCARASSGLASIAIIQNRSGEAISLMKFSEAIYRNLSHHSGLSRTLNDMGVLEKAKGNYADAITHFAESIELRKEIDHLQGLITTYTEVGETYLMSGQPAKALEKLKKGLELSVRVKSAQKQMRLHKLIYEAYKALNDVPKALENFEAFHEIKSKLLSDESSNNIKRLHTRHEKEKAEQQAEIERLRNIELKMANDIIEQKNKDILDSIHYSKRIQVALLPAEAYIERNLKRLKNK
jgi:tetratricopeptide (TPR) repeat protein